MFASSKGFFFAKLPSLVTQPNSIEGTMFLVSEVKEIVFPGQ